MQAQPGKQFVFRIVNPAANSIVIALFIITSSIDACQLVVFGTIASEQPHCVCPRLEEFHSTLLRACLLAGRIAAGLSITPTTD